MVPSSRSTPKPLPGALAPALFTVAFALITISLAVRAWVREPPAVFHDADIGGWTMYREHVDALEVAMLTSEHGVIPVPHRLYVWHGLFIGTHHPRLSQATVDAFADFLATRSELRGLSPPPLRGASWQIRFSVRYRINGGELKVLEAERQLTGSSR